MLESRSLYLSLEEKDLASEDKLIAAKLANSEKILTEFKGIVDNKKFIIGNDLPLHFAKYIGLVNMRMNFKNSSFDKYTDNIGLKSVNEMLSSMRFNSYDARKMASSGM